MKIAILIPNFVEFDGGAQNARIHAEQLAKEGHYVAIFTFAANIEPKGVDIYVMKMPRNPFWERIYRLLFPLDIFKSLKWLPKLKVFDEVIAYYYPMTWLAFLARKFYSYSVRYTFRYSGIMNPALLPQLHEKVYMRLHILFTRLTVRNADRVISVSRFAQDELKRYTGLESEVVRDLVDKERFHPKVDGKIVREKFGLRNAPVILSVGVIRPVKGFHLLVKAFDLIKREIPETKLVIIGKPTFKYYFEQIKQMSDSGVIFVDYVSNRDLPSYFAACDIYATCSLWETFNRPLAEAQACGKPVVAFNIGAHHEVINESGILVEQGNIEKFAQACIEKLNQVRGRGVL